MVILLFYTSAADAAAAAASAITVVIASRSRLGFAFEEAATYDMHFYLIPTTAHHALSHANGTLKQQTGTPTKHTKTGIKMIPSNFFRVLCHLILVLLRIPFFNCPFSFLYSTLGIILLFLLHIRCFFN